MTLNEVRRSRRSLAILAVATAVMSAAVVSTAAVVTAALATGAAAPDPAGPSELLPHRTDLTPKDRAKVAKVLKAPIAFAKPEPFEPMSGGAATSRRIVNRDAFSQFSANLSFEDQQTFKVGNGIFRKFWVAAPASTQVSDGLGPLYMALADAVRGGDPETAKAAMMELTTAQAERMIDAV